MFSSHNDIKLELRNKRMSKKSPNIWKLHNALLNHYGSEEIKREFRKYFELSENENVTHGTLLGQYLEGNL